MCSILVFNRSVSFLRRSPVALYAEEPRVAHRDLGMRVFLARYHPQAGHLKQTQLTSVHGKHWANTFSWTLGVLGQQERHGKDVSFFS